jgi:hypothetical protein
MHRSDAIISDNKVQECSSFRTKPLLQHQREHHRKPSKYEMLFLLSLLLFGTLTLSTSPSLEHQGSQSTDIYICGDAKFDNTSGTCHNYAVAASKCFNLPREASKKASSAGPNEGTFCVLYS